MQELTLEEKVKREIRKDMYLKRIPRDTRGRPKPIFYICQKCKKNKVTNHHYLCDRCHKEKYGQ